MYKLACRAHGAKGAYSERRNKGTLMITKDQLIMKLLTAPSDNELLERLNAILENKHTEITPADRRLLTLGDAAKALNISRMTVFRMTRDGRLPVVETRAGRFRVPSSALTALLQDGRSCVSKREVGHA